MAGLAPKASVGFDGMPCGCRMREHHWNRCSGIDVSEGYRYWIGCDPCEAHRESPYDACDFDPKYVNIIRCEYNPDELEVGPMWEKLIGMKSEQLAELFEKLGGDRARMNGLNRFGRASLVKSSYTEQQINEKIGHIPPLFVEPGSTPPAPTPVFKEGDTAGQIAALFASISGQVAHEARQAANEDRINAIVQSSIDRIIKEIKKDKVATIEVKIPEKQPINVGVQHKNFEILLKAVSARTHDGMRLNIWLAGPAGSGKTTAARMVAKALECEFISNGAISTPYELTGFMSATGVYVSTPFRKAWENGGVYLFDEVDASSPNAVTAFNAALSNGHFAFPDGMVTRHADCCVIAGANTSGNGATHEYVGRMKQDKAFLDRFVEIEWPIDEVLEKSIVDNKEWIATVQNTRRNVASRSIKGHMVTPRASVFGSALLDAGIDLDTVKNMTLKKGLGKTEWDQIK